MKFFNTFLGLVALAHGIAAVSVPDTDVATLETRIPQSDVEIIPDISATEELVKRKGGGGRGGRGGAGASSGGGKGGRVGLGSSSSNTGGRTTTGSGPAPRFGGLYSGGAAVPYASGTRSGNIAPFLLTGALLGGIAFLGVHYAFGAWAYPYTHTYFYHNATTNQNETKPVVCMCDASTSCGCADNGNQTFFQSVIGDGSYQNMNHSLVTVAENETTHQQTIYINGGLPNGTTAPGGSVSPNAAASMKSIAQAVGWWPVAAVALTLAFSL
ncbi:hypothetical protein GGS21DRAFT_502549 [Xylaria nigripes]|nr:hypothetical protein GGS21DRAFT_502549 [Xylaria nigripes]